MLDRQSLYRGYSVAVNRCPGRAYVASSGPESILPELCVLYVLVAGLRRVIER